MLNQTHEWSARATPSAAQNTQFYFIDGQVFQASIKISEVFTDSFGTEFPVQTHAQTCTRLCTADTQWPQTNHKKSKIHGSKKSPSKHINQPISLNLEASIISILSEKWKNKLYSQIGNVFVQESKYSDYWKAVWSCLWCKFIWLNWFWYNNLF